MAKVNQEIIFYLEKVRAMYQTIDDTTLKKDIQKIGELIAQLRGESSTPQLVKKKENSYRESLLLLLDKKYELLKGTRVNFEQVLSSEDVVAFFEFHSEKDILAHTTALDLKLLYTVLTGEHRELKGKKEELLQTIKRNIRARKRGEAFSK